MHLSLIKYFFVQSRIIAWRLLCEGQRIYFVVGTINITKFRLYKKINYMPEIFRIFGMRFFFYSREHEPMHVHVKNADGFAKFFILEDGIVLIKNDGMKIKDIKAAEMVLEENRELAIEKWNEYFGKSVRDEND